MILAMGLRCILIPMPIAHHPDEVWQYLEPAYGLITGKWIMAWEFHAGIRTWLIPVFLALPMSIGHALSPDTDLHLILVRAVLAVASLSVVISFYLLGRTIGRTHAIIAGFVGASWFEIVYFSSRALSDAIELSLALPAILLLHRLRTRQSALSAFIAGLLLALCFSVRFQLAPALLVLAIWGCGLRIRSAWLPLIAGATTGLGIDVLADLHAGQTPLVWIVRNLQINLMQGKSATFGTEPWYWYITQICRTWGLGAILIFPLGLAGGRRFPGIMLASIVIIGLHSAIPHKEYRFVLLGIDLFVLLAAIGSADLLSWMLSRQKRIGLRGLTAIACATWFLLSVYGAATKPFRYYWQAGVPSARALATAGRVPGICGLALYKPSNSPSAAYVQFNRPTPIYLLQGATAQQDLSRAAPTFNVVEAPVRYGAELGPDYHFLSCSQKPKPTRPRDFCVYVRPGSCTPGNPAFSYNRVLSSIGK